MKGIRQYIKSVKISLIGLISLLVVFAISTTAQMQGIDCRSSDYWVMAYNGKPINHTHIFCGEINQQGRLVGFHARPRGQNPSTVRQFTVTQPANAQGIYGGEWTYAGSPPATKFSTMFPDRCTRDQIINSIAYAEGNRVQCPSSAPDWAWCGLNRVADGQQQNRFCIANNSATYMIAGATNRDNQINTAFPLRR